MKYEVLRIREATGYNVLRSINGMPITSRRKLIFYSNYIRRARHFGLLLAEMERDGLIMPEQVRFGVKASKVVHTDGWEISPLDEQTVRVERINDQGQIEQRRASQTIEAVVIISPTDDIQARRIAEMLLARTNARIPGAIEDSWDIPDIRATARLRGALTQSGFREVRANILREGRSRLLVARQETAFPDPWQRARMEMNPELATYLASPELGVNP